jgi:hypothetical protein
MLINRRIWRKPLNPVFSTTQRPELAQLEHVRRIRRSQLATHSRGYHIRFGFKQLATAGNLSNDKILRIDVTGQGNYFQERLVKVDAARWLGVVSVSMRQPTWYGQALITVPRLRGLEMQCTYRHAFPKSVFNSTSRILVLGLRILGGQHPGIWQLNQQSGGIPNRISIE